MQTVALKFQRARVFLLSLACLLLPALAFAGENWAKYETVSYSVSHSAEVSPTPVPGDLWLPIPAAQTADLRDWGKLDFFRPMGLALFRATQSGPGTSEPVLGIYTARLPSRHASGAWAQVRAGYGDVMVEDNVGRGGMSGAGHEDPDFAYVKLSFRF